MVIKERDGFVRVVASFEVSQTLWWKRWRMRLSLLLLLGFGCGEEKKMEKCDD